MEGKGERSEGKEKGVDGGVKGKGGSPVRGKEEVLKPEKKQEEKSGAKEKGGKEGWRGKPFLEGGWRWAPFSDEEWAA